MNELPPASKNSDPSSSHEAEEYINKNGIRLTQTEIVAKLVSAYPGCTASELIRQQTKLTEMQIRRRLPDARTKNLIDNGGIRKSAVSGRNEETWYPKSTAEDYRNAKG